MTNEQQATLVLKDTAGDYFLVSLAALEQGRVPEEHKAEVEQAVGATQSGAGAEDVQGHLYGLVVAVGVGYFVTKAIIEGSREEPGPTVGEYLERMRGVGEGLQQRNR
jgi:hypothetical protein